MILSADVEEVLQSRAIHILRCGLQPGGPAHEWREAIQINDEKNTALTEFLMIMIMTMTMNLTRKIITMGITWYSVALGQCTRPCKKPD